MSADLDPRATRFFGTLLLAKNFQETLSFYSTLLGIAFTGAFPYAKHASESATLSIVDGRWWADVNGSENPFQGESSVANGVVVIEVANVAEFSERLMAAGVKFQSVPTYRPQLGIKNVFLRDPDGRCVMINSRAG